MKKTNLKSDCHGKPAIETVDGRYFCGGIEGCGRYCKATPGGVPKEEPAYIGGVNFDPNITTSNVNEIRSRLEVQKAEIISLIYSMILNKEVDDIEASKIVNKIRQ